MLNTVEVRSPACVVSVTPTITAGAYTAGDCVGDAQLLGNTVRTPGRTNPVSTSTTDQGTTVLQSITVSEYSPSGIMTAGALDFFFFSSLPGGEYLDNGAPDPAPTDPAILVGVASIASADYIELGATVTVASTTVGLVLPAGVDVADLYVVTTTTSSPTFELTNSLTFKFGFLQN